MPQTFDTLRIRNVIGFRSDQVYLWPPVATAPTGSCCKAWRGLRPTLAAGTDPVLCGRDNSGQSAVSCSERQGGLGSPLEILACRVGPHPLPTERSPCGAQMAAEWPAARGASVQREGRSPCSRRLGAAPRSPSSVAGGEKAPRAPPALLLARRDGPGAHDTACGTAVRVQSRAFWSSCSRVRHTGLVLEKRQELSRSRLKSADRQRPGCHRCQQSLSSRETRRGFEKRQR